MSPDLDADIDGGAEAAVPVWAAFGDLMSILLGAFVLILIGMIAMQLQLEIKLDREIAQRKAETQRRLALERALAAPLASGRITLVDGRIGIRGNLLFALNSDRLQPEGRELLKTLAGPLARYLRARDEVLMISGYTDDRQVSADNPEFADNWELSAQRSLTVTRALIAEGLPSSSVFAAAFGAEQPVGSNRDETGRARNRRVELAPVPRLRRTQAGTDER